MRGLRAQWVILLGGLLVGTGAGLDAVAQAVPPPTLAQRAMASGLADGPGASDEAATLEHMVGQKLMITMRGHKPSAALMRRVRGGQVGGVILLARNITTRPALLRITRELQRAATEGGQPPLLIAIDQEGGSVKRIAWAPPTMTVPQMGRIGSTAVARAQGARTGAVLRRFGINVDLAPVADIPRSRASFMLQQGRTFSFDSKRTARLADAFASGLASRGVLATMKHFPGIGLATRNTDLLVDTITASRATLRTDLRPYRLAIGHAIPLIMLSNATYPAYDRSNAAGWSRAIADKLLRRDLGFTGVSITDSLNGTANARGKRVTTLAIRAAKAGTDMILVTGSERSSSRLFKQLLARARDGSMPLTTLRASYERIIALKGRL